jgi:hypothetical protein
MVRRSTFVAVLALMAVPFAATGSSAQQAPDLTFTVRKVVSGAGTGPSSVGVSCALPGAATAQYAAVLNFDAQGTPTTSDDESFEIVDGAWSFSQVNTDLQECDFTETDAGGATSTTWTCAYDFDPVSVPEAAQIEEAGCAADAGTGTGPVHVVYPPNSEVELQASTVTFTNSFTTAPLEPLRPAAQVVAQPVFTG